MQCCSRAKLFDKYVTIIPAPNPTEILWTNLYYPKIKRYIIRCLCLVLAFGCIACTSYLTLFLQSYNPMPWLKPTILLTMSVLLKLFIKQLTLC